MPVQREPECITCIKLARLRHPGCIEAHHNILPDGISKFDLFQHNVLIRTVKHGQTSQLCMHPNKINFKCPCTVAVVTVTVCTSLKCVESENWKPFLICHILVFLKSFPSEFDHDFLLIQSPVVFPISYWTPFYCNNAFICVIIVSENVSNDANFSFVKCNYNFMFQDIIHGFSQHFPGSVDEKHTKYFWCILNSIPKLIVPRSAKVLEQRIRTQICTEIPISCSHSVPFVKSGTQFSCVDSLIKCLRSPLCSFEGKCR